MLYVLTCHCIYTNNPPILEYQPDDRHFQKRGEKLESFADDTYFFFFFNTTEPLDYPLVLSYEGQIYGVDFKKLFIFNSDHSIFSYSAVVMKTVAHELRETYAVGP